MAAFHASKARRRGIRGPIGSGKSTGCSIELFTRACRQKVIQDNIRMTRFAIVRNTYPQLRDTTLKTWLYWFPERHFGDFNYGNFEHRLTFVPGDGTVVQSEILFRALDRPDHVANLLSLELTGAWVNEAREMPWGIIQALDDRIGRFPAKKDGGCTWRGMIMDTNPPDDDSWWFSLAEEHRPPGFQEGDVEPDLSGWDFFVQPGGMIEDAQGIFVVNAKAENLAHLEDNFYEERAQGKNKDHIRVYYCNRYGFVLEGKPVFPEYRDEVHCAQHEIKLDRSLPVIVGCDFGLTPAALFAQQDRIGRWKWIDELVTEDMGATKFGGLLRVKCEQDFKGCEMFFFGDPSGDDRAQSDETTPIQILQGMGINIVAAPTNDPIIRRDAVAKHMNKMYEGKPCFLISPKCRVARKGLMGGYCLRRLMVVGAERYREVPEKNRFSHVCEAGEYAHIGWGEGADVLGLPEDETEDEMDDWADAGRSAVTGY